MRSQKKRDTLIQAQEKKEKRAEKNKELT